MRNVGLIFIREFQAYFSTPLAYIFIVIFLMLAGLLTFFMGVTWSVTKLTSCPFSNSILGYIFF